MEKTKDSKSGMLTKPELIELIDNQELYIAPLLSRDQIGEITIDLRIGLDFLTCNQGREAYLDATIDQIDNRPLKSHFTETRRKLGESFLFHSNQTVLFSTLEYLKLPDDVFAILSTRSSYSRLGLTVSTIVQPGYCGCVSVEITNPGNTAIKVLAGARLLQARFYKIDNSSQYFSSSRKYVCQVRPIASKANEDNDLKLLLKIKQSIE